MILTVVVGLVAGLGALTRYVIDEVIEHQHDTVFPIGTFTINITGSLLLGLVTGLAAHHGLPTGAAVVLSAGFCSGYTTWSTFAYETLALAETGALLEAAGNLAVSVGVGLAAAAAGFALALL
ncbi:MAG: fluoride efflux transporter CrcB [Pseudonocardiales bacterium]|nr:MAG: fluoride efflux transporter CrcB [Pseudonocardiales bacterium]